MENSSPPHLQIISSFLQHFFRIAAIFFNNLSPSLGPNASFISFNPLTSPIIKLNGSCLFVSSLLISSSKYVLLYNPVNLSFNDKFIISSSVFFRSRAFIRISPNNFNRVISLMVHILLLFIDSNPIKPSRTFP